MIRSATTDDIDAIVGLGARFANLHPLRPVCRPGPIRETIERLLTKGQCVKVAESDGVIVGAILGIESTYWFDPTVAVAMELAWWIDDRVRNSGVGIRLLRAFEVWAATTDAQVLVLSDMVGRDGEPMLGDLTTRLGYRLTERSHVKTI